MARRPGRLIQIIDDDQVIYILLAKFLSAEGFEVAWTTSGVEGLREIKKRGPDLLILDRMLPDLTGIEICTQIRGSKELKRLPILMLTARGEEVDRVQGLDAGADDYLVKPFSGAELVARVKALLRRATPPDDAETILRAGNLVLDPDSLRVSVVGEEVQVTALEFRLLHYLASHPNRLFSRAQLLSAVWGEEHFVAPRIVDVYIRQLRRKLTSGAADLLKTVRGSGYMFELPKS